MTLTQQNAHSTPRLKRPKDRADQILAASAKLFAERGFTSVGIDDIGDAVGITGPAVYRHFESKEALLLSIFDRYNARFLELFTQAVGESDTAAQRVAALVRSTVSEMVDDRDLLAVVMREARHIPRERQKKVLQGRRKAVRLWTDALQQERPELTPELAHFVVEAVGGVAASVLYHRPQLSRSQLKDMLSKMGVTAIEAPLPPAGPPAPERRREPNGASALSTRRPARRETILRAGIHLFASQGFGGVGIDEIGSASGITGSGVYRHFPSKEAILAAALNRAGEHLAATVSSTLALGLGPHETVADLVRHYVEFASVNTDLLIVYLSEAQALSAGPLNIVKRSKKAYIEDWVEALRDVHTGLTEAEARTMVHAAMGIVERYGLSDDLRATADGARIIQTMATEALLATPS